MEDGNEGLKKKSSNNEVTRIEDNINSGVGYYKIYIYTTKAFNAR